jgi:hypothetical protein
MEIESDLTVAYFGLKLRCVYPDRVITITSINNTLVVNDTSASNYVVTISSLNSVEVLKGTVKKVYLTEYFRGRGKHRCSNRVVIIS